MSDPAEPLAITATANGIAVSGEIDAHTAPAVAAALAAAEHDPLVVDLSSVEFVDSSGLRVLLEAHQTRQAAGGTLTLANPSPAVQRVLDIAGVVEYLHIVGAPDR